MQRILLLLATCCAFAVAHAQVTVQLLLDQEQFLRNESLPVRLRISNFSGQTLRLGEQSDWLSFTIEREGKALARTAQIPLPKTLTIESAKSISLRTDLMPYFDLGEVGHYTVTVKVRIPQIQKEFVTEPKGFDITSGTKLWEREFGVPGTTPIELRKYALQQATFLKQLRLYARVTDANESTTLRVVALGTLYSFSTPDVHLDASSNLHVLFQNSARGFLYAVVAPDGELIIRQTHDYAGDSRPRLRVEKDGRISVAGGLRRILLSDLPPPRVANTNDTTQGK